MASGMPVGVFPILHSTQTALIESQVAGPPINILKSRWGWGRTNAVSGSSSVDNLGIEFLGHYSHDSSARL